MKRHTAKHKQQYKPQGHTIYHILCAIFKHDIQGWYLKSWLHTIQHADQRLCNLIICRVTRVKNPSDAGQRNHCTDHKKHEDLVTYTCEMNTMTSFYNHTGCLPNRGENQSSKPPLINITQTLAAILAQSAHRIIFHKEIGMLVSPTKKLTCKSYIIFSHRRSCHFHTFQLECSGKPLVCDGKDLYCYSHIFTWGYTSFWT